MHEILPKVARVSSLSKVKKPTRIPPVLSEYVRPELPKPLTTADGLRAEQPTLLRERAVGGYPAEKPSFHSLKTTSPIQFSQRRAANPKDGFFTAERKREHLPWTPANPEPSPHSDPRCASVHAGVLKARRIILEQAYQRAKRNGSNWWGTNESRLHEITSKSIGFELVRESPKLRNLAYQYWVLLEPPKKTQLVEPVLEPVLEHLHTAAGEQPFKNTMHSLISVLTTPTADTPGTTLLLHFDNRRYLIGNISEGVQRSMVERGIRMAKIEHVFVTGAVDWRSIGGSIGVVLTLADVLAAQQDDIRDGKGSQDKRVLTLHGGKNLTHFLGTTRRFVFRKGMPVQTNETTEESDAREGVNISPTWKDDNIMVWAMPIAPETSPRDGRKRSYDMLEGNTKTTETLNKRKEAREEERDANDQIRRGVVSSMFNSDWRLDSLKRMKLSEVRLPAAIFQRNSEGKIEEYNGPLPGGKGAAPDIDVLVRNPWPGASIETLPPTTPSMTSICYIFKQHPYRGRFNAHAAKKLGVQPGPMFRKLTNGESITTAAGNIVTPNMVIGKERIGLGIAVVDLPTRSYVENLISRKEWSSKSLMNGIKSIIWILGKGVLGDEKLINFMQEHGNLRHDISSPDLCANYLAMESVASAAVKLNVLDPERFPVPVHNNDVLLDEPKDFPLYRRLQVGMAYDLCPEFSVDSRSLLKPLDTTTVAKTFPEEVLKLANDARKTINDPAYLAKLEELQMDLPGKDVEVITLGTGSALPSKYRNVSSTMIRVPGYGNYLFDCGEGTLGQLKRVFGSELPQILRDLKVIWISHLHADHHLGTIGVIKAFHEEMSSHDPTSAQKLIVASNEVIFTFLDEYAEVEDYGHSRIYPLRMNEITNQHAKFTPSQISAYGVSSIQACAVDHCAGALAVVFNFPDGFKVAYSGDCRPSTKFAEIGQGATLLIHEATFDDELTGDATAKKHCTKREALDVASQMGARRVLLTHFSQRYQKFPMIDEPSKSEAAASKHGESRIQVNGEGAKDRIAIVGFDYMRCRIEDFSKVAAFHPALVKLYEREAEKWK
jgi:ribonuclease Z